MMHQNKKTVVWPWKRIRTKKSLPSKLEQGLNFTVIVDFWFCNGDFCTKTWGKKKSDFSWFYMRLKRVIFVIVQIQLLDIPI